MPTGQDSLLKKQNLMTKIKVKARNPKNHHSTTERGPHGQLRQHIHRWTTFVVRACRADMRLAHYYAVADKLNCATAAAPASTRCVYAYVACTGWLNDFRPLTSPGRLTESNDLSLL